MFPLYLVSSYLFLLVKRIREKQTEQRASQVALQVKNPLANAGDVRDVGSIPGLRGSSGGGYGNPLQYSCLENPMDSEAWRATSPWGGKESDLTEEKRLNTHVQSAGKNYLHGSAALTLSTPTTILNNRACYYHPIFHMGKLRHRAVQLLVWGHTGSKQQSWDLNSGTLDPGSTLLTTRPFTKVIGPASQASRVRCTVDGGAQAGMERPGEEQLGGCE